MDAQSARDGRWAAALAWSAALVGILVSQPTRAALDEASCYRRVGRTFVRVENIELNTFGRCLTKARDYVSCSSAPLAEAQVSKTMWTLYHILADCPSVPSPACSALDLFG